jgi:hypothetical protein
MIGFQFKAAFGYPAQQIAGPLSIANPDRPRYNPHNSENVAGRLNAVQPNLDFKEKM